MAQVDAVVIGAGPNGLVAANLLADQGWDVLVLEAQPEPGGAVRSAELTKPGYAHDVFSSFYPLGAASPVLRQLRLEDHGLRWRRAPLVLAHPVPDGRCAVLSTDLDETAASLDTFAPGDGDAWRELYDLWDRLGDDVVQALLRPFPPVGPAARLLGRLRPTEVLRFVRFVLLPVRRMAEEAFQGEGGRLLLAGNALHADLAPETAGSGIFGWLLSALGQQLGFPVPEGGAGRLTDALVNRLQHAGGTLRTDTAVTGIEVEHGRAVAVRTAAGETIWARRAILADVGAPALYQRLLPAEVVPERTRRDLRHFQYDNGTVKVDWAIDGEVPWTAEQARQAGTVHVADSLNHLTAAAAHLASGRIPATPFLLMGQMHVADPTRSPAGTGTVWAYTHVPNGARLEGPELERFADHMEELVEAYAPGFRQCVTARHVMGPADLEARNANLVGGAINGGTAALYQQLVFRPVPGFRTATTPIGGLYLASASAHPGGGVHGACGANAAHAALRGRGLSRRL
jgi:phytoene dehydrogenase-like protein